jgi:hypothetical protein
MKADTEGRTNMRETKKKFQEKRVWLLGDPHKVGTPRRRRRRRKRKKRNVQVMVSEFRALHYSQSSLLVQQAIDQFPYAEYMFAFSHFSFAHKQAKQTNKQTRWPESASKLYRLSDRRL